MFLSSLFFEAARRLPRGRRGLKSTLLRDLIDGYLVASREGGVD